MVPLPPPPAAPLAAPLARAPLTLSLAPTDDVWVYPHASDPGRDEWMRVWGSGGRAVAPSPGEAEDFSYGYLRFVLPPEAKGKRLVGATLELANVANPELGDMAPTPLEVRPLLGKPFAERAWAYTDALATYPDAKTVWGSGVPTFASPEATGKLAIDLLGKGSAFGAWWAGSGGAGDLPMALTSRVDAAEVGMRRIFKVATHEAGDPARRPALRLTLGE